MEDNEKLIAELVNFQPHAAGDGFIFNGETFLKVAPSMESYALIAADKENTKKKN